MGSNEGFLRIRVDAFRGEYWIHPKREVDWIRTRTLTGKWMYFGEETLLGSKGKARRVRVGIEGRLYYRHRLTALAKDDGDDALDKFKGGAKHPVLHGERREEDARPNDEDVKFGTPKENSNDPNNKKRKPNASGHPVLLTSATTTEPPLRFDSVTAVAKFLGTDPGYLRRYLIRKKTSRMNMPACERDGVWELVYDEFELEDAARLVRAAAELYLSPSCPNRLFRKLKTGKFAATELERGDDGYVQVPVRGGKTEMLQRLVVDTLDPGAFAAKMAKNPGLSVSDLVVYHVDGDENNNAIGNLEVLTKRERARKHAHAVEWLNARRKPIWMFECAEDVVETVRGVDGRRLNKGNVRMVCNGERTHTGGRFFRWAYLSRVKAKRDEKRIRLA
jgi:hypothetical protein